MNIKKIIEIYFNHSELKIEALMRLSHYKRGQRRSKPISKRLFKTDRIPVLMEKRLPEKLKNRAEIEVSFKYYPRSASKIPFHQMKNPVAVSNSYNSTGCAVTTSFINLKVIGLTKILSLDEWNVNISNPVMLERAMLGARFLTEIYIREHTEEFYTR